MAKLPRTTFCASAYDPNKRYDTFRESMGCVFDVEKPTKKGSDFDAKLESYLLGDCMFVRTETAGHVFSRSAAKIGRDGIDHFLIQFFTDGCKDLRTGDQGVVDSGSLVVIDTAHPYEAVTSDFANVTLVVPRRLMSEDLRSPDGHPTRVLSERDPLARLAYDAVRSLWRNTPDFTTEQAAVALPPTIDLVVAAMNGKPHVTRNGSRAIQAVLRQKIRDYIEQNLHDPGLSATTLQNEFRIRRTKLYEMFQEQGGIAKLIRDARLSHSVSMLVASTAAHLNVTEIGAQCGFDNPTVFGRAFKKQFGMTPTDARSMGRALPPQAPGGSSDRLWEDWVRSL